MLGVLHSKIEGLEIATFACKHEALICFKHIASHPARLQLINVSVLLARDSGTSLHVIGFQKFTSIFGKRILQFHFSTSCDWLTSLVRGRKRMNEKSFYLTENE